MELSVYKYRFAYFGVVYIIFAILCYVQKSVSANWIQDLLGKSDRLAIEKSAYSSDLKRYALSAQQYPQVHESTSHMYRPGIIRYELPRPPPQRLTLRGTGVENANEPHLISIENPILNSRKRSDLKPLPIMNDKRLKQEVLICRDLSGLTEKQRQICLHHTGLVWAMLEGTQLGLHECIHQFKHEQWNCSAVNLLYGAQHGSSNVPPISGLEGILQRGSRETAFLSSAWAAGVVQAITRACSQGQMGTCDCDPLRREGQDQDSEGIFTWGGCSDPIKFAMRLTRLFLDANDRELWDRANRRETELHGKRAKQNKIKRETRSSSHHFPGVLNIRKQRTMTLRNTDSLSYDATQSNYSTDEVTGAPDIKRFQWVSPEQLQAETLHIIQTKARTQMNIHNRRTGRRLVWFNRMRKCKCHGVSGACTMRTCWQRVNEFRKVGKVLKSAYDEALRVTYDPRRDKLRPVQQRVPHANTWSTMAVSLPIDIFQQSQAASNFVPTRIASTRSSNMWKKRRWFRDTSLADIIPKNQLVYLEESPNYCRYDPTIGHPGVAGRSCNATSTYSANSCKRLCCDRGYERIEYEFEQKCDCKFFWCCEVKCNLCRERIVEYRCKA